MRSSAIALIIAGLMLPAVTAAQPTPNIGLYADFERTAWYVMSVGPYSPFQCWVWIEPGPDGSQCAEFKLNIPDNVLPISHTMNSVFVLTIVPPNPPWESPGSLWCFEDCQTDPYWICYIDLLFLDYEQSCITVAPYEDSGLVASTSCLAATEEMLVTNPLLINSVPLITPAYPHVGYVYLATYTAFYAQFDRDLMEPPEPWQFELWAMEDPDTPIESIEVIGAEIHPVYGDDYVIINIASPMTHGQFYKLVANDLCYPCFCGNSYCYFTFDEGIAPLNTSWGAIKAMDQ